MGLANKVYTPPIPTTATVATPAGLPANAGLPDGSLAWVQSVRDYYTVQPSTLAPDGITIIAADAGRNWQRMGLGDEVWRRRATWQIDNVAGNDATGDGSVANPIATLSELVRRWGKNPTVFSTTVTIAATGLPASDQVDLEFFCGNDAVITFQGTATVQAAGTFNAVTARNRATNQRWLIGDAVIVNWAPHVGRRVRITAGPRAGASARVFAATGAQAFTSEWGTYSAFGTFTPVTPQVGDTFAVETDSSVTLGMLRVTGDLQGSVGLESVEFRRLAFASSGFGEVMVDVPAGLVSFDDCTISPNWYQHGGVAYYTACHFAQLSVRGQAVLNAGQGILTAYPGSYVTADFDTLFKPLSVQGYALLGNVGFFGSGQFGLYIGYGGTVLNDRVVEAGNAQLWGSGQTTYGAYIDLGAQLFFDVPTNTPTVTGTLGDFFVGRSNVARAWDPATGAYTTTRACSWANFAATIAGGGFNGQAHNPVANSHVVNFASVAP